MVATTSISEWDANDISLVIGGVEIPDYVDFSWNNKNNISHIVSSNKGPTGYNEKYGEPRAQATINATSEALTTLNQWKKDKTTVNFTFMAPGLVVKGYDCKIEDISPGRVVDKAPTVTVSIIALKIDDDWNPKKVPGASDAQA